MNLDSFFSDTFDNFSFSPSIEINKLTNNEIGKNKNNDKSLITNANVNQMNNIKNINISQEFEEEISVNDSVFLSDCFSSYIKNEKSQNNSKNTSSDDIFEENDDSDFSQLISQNNNSIKSKNTPCDPPSTQAELPKRSLGGVSQKLNLSAWGLPETILNKYKARKITTMFEWQLECLNNENILLNNSNLVYSAPTSAGKTLVSEILAIKTLIEKKKKVIFILPFVSIVREKTFYFQDILGSAGIRVAGFMGASNPPGGFHKIQVAVCTIEKGNSLINKMLEEGTLNKLGAVIVDEMHLIRDSSRGYQLELLITKLLYMQNKKEDVDVQIIGMSATLPNLNVLARWLNAELYTTSFRPIPLSEKCYVSGEIYNNDFTLERRLSPLPELETDTDNILQMCLENLSQSCSVLIFCPTKNWCETLSQQISAAFCKLANTSSQSKLGQMVRTQLNQEKISEVIEQLRRSPAGLDAILYRTVSFGVAFHHAGLTMDERDIIEGGFRLGTLRVLVATSTLSSGVNLPAKRVIIRTPLFHGKVIDTLTYRQMIGRAGRFGQDVSGESILICQKNDLKIAKELLSASLNPVESCLEESGRLKRAVLEVIASGVVSSPEDAQVFGKCTLLGFTKSEDNLSNPIEDSIQFLQENQFIRLQQQEDGSMKYIATSLAKACLSSSMPPEEGLSLFTELEKARQCFVLENELHLIYLVTPYSACNQWGSMDWMLFLDIWEKLTKSMKRVGELVGISESYIVSGTRGKIKTNTAKLYHKLQIHKRFFTALALQDLINEIPLNYVASKFNCSRGMLQSLQQSASTFAGMVTMFSRKLGWSCIELLVSQFQDRLQFGVSRELLDLMKLPILNGPRARALFDAGVETMAQLATSSACDIENILITMSPFESEKERDGETEYDARKRNKIRNIWITGMDGMTEKDFARLLIDEARNYLQLEMGLKDAKWGSEDETVRGSLNSETVESQIDDSLTDASDKKTAEIVEEINDKVISNCSGNNDDLIASDGSFTLQLSTNSSIEENIKSKIVVSHSSNDSLEKLFEDNSIEEEKEIITERTKKSSVDSGLEELNNLSFIEKAFLNSFDINSSPSDKENKDDELENDDCIIDYSQENLPPATTTYFTTISECGNSRKAKYLRSSLDFTEIITTPSKKKKNNSPQPKSKLCVQENNDVSDVNIVDVSDSYKVFENFTKDVMSQKKIALSIACVKAKKVEKIIGLNIIKNKPDTSEKNNFIYGDKEVVGVSLSWGENTSYFINLTQTNIINNKREIEVIQNIFSNKSTTIIIFESKKQLRILNSLMKLNVQCCLEDPKVANWLLDPEEKEKSFNSMVLHYTPNFINISQSCDCYKSMNGLGLDISSSIDPKIRSSIEVVTNWSLNIVVKNVLVEKYGPKFLNTFRAEMKNVICLSEMEVNGIGVGESELQKLIDLLTNECTNLERKAFSITGKRFSFTSSKEVAKVLGLYNKGKKVSTSKQILENIDHPLAKIIMEWRKLNNTLIKMIYPLLRVVKNERIYGTCIIYNATGRVSMQEPNLQNVPRNYELLDPITCKKVDINCREAFVAPEGRLFLSADYCQLELRLLAHLSKDETLCSVLRSSGDVFTSIAAEINNISEIEVTTTLRQRAKQICYGIIYGMGSQSLSEQLSVSEEDAQVFMDSFHSKYPKIKRFIADIIERCKEDGYVETLAGRRRYLTHINDENLSFRGQAERQSVNTTIQGSAADIAKKATVLICSNFKKKFVTSDVPKLVLQLHDEFLFEVPEKIINDSALVLKQTMENVVRLSVPFPVKLKFGKSWGNLQQFSL